MIVSLEGIDGCGKTTMWRELRDRFVLARFVPSLPLTKGLFAEMGAIERRDLLFWRAMYDPSQLYICDRTTFVSGPVYAEAYGREPVETSEWQRYVRVLYMVHPMRELVKNHRDEYVDVAELGRIRSAYEAQLARWNYRNIDRDGVRDATRMICTWWMEWMTGKGSPGIQGNPI